MSRRKFAKMPVSIWHNNEIKQFGVNTILTSIYLRSSPHSTMIYLYVQHPEYAAVDIGITVAEYFESLNNLQSIGYCRYDSKTNTVWLRDAMVEDLGIELKINANGKPDNKIIAIQYLIESLQDSHVLSDFKDEFRLKYKLNYKGLGKGLGKQVRSEKYKHNHDKASASPVVLLPNNVLKMTTGEKQ